MYIFSRTSSQIFRKVNIYASCFYPTKYYNCNLTFTPFVFYKNYGPRVYFLSLK